MKKNRQLHTVLNRKGMTLVEVMAAFVILLMGMAALMHATTLSLKLINKSQEVQREADAAISDYYMGEGDGASGQDVAVSLVPEDGKDAGSVEVKLYTYESPKTEELEGGYHLYYFRSDGGGDGE